MTSKTIKHILLAAILAAGFAGCQSTLSASHDKFVKPAHEQWDRERMGIMVEVAQQEYKVGDYDKCRETLKGALAGSAPIPAALVLSAKVELEGGSLELAANQLKKALAANTAANVIDPEPYYLLGVVYQRWQQMDTACTYYEQAAAKKADEAVYVLAIAEMKIAMGKLDDAKDLLETKLSFFEQSAAMRIALARIASLQGDPAAAANHYRDATLLAPENNNLRMAYAGALFDAGKYNDAAKILEDLRKAPMELPKASNALTKATDEKTDEEGAKINKVTLLMMLGESYVSLNRPIDARDCFQDVIRVQPENLNAYLSLGKACLMSNDLSVTAAAARRVLRTDPQNLEAFILEAAVQQKQKKWSDALDTLSDAAKISPKDPTVLCMQGLSALQLGKKDMATGFFERAVAANPTDTWANELLSQVKPPEPVKDVKPAVENKNELPTGPAAKADGVEGLIPAAANGAMIGGDGTTAGISHATALVPSDVSGQ